MSELQTEDAVSNDVGSDDIVNAEDTGTVVESGPDLAAGTGENQEEKTDNVDQDSVQKVINKKHWEAREAERKAEAAEQRAKELEAKLQELKAPQEPVVPPIPDPYDDDYEEKVKARDNALQEKARYDANAQYAQQQQQYLQQQQIQQQQQKAQELVNEFSERTVKLGLDTQEVEQAAAKVVQYGIDPALGQYMMAEEEGPLLVTHLSKNPQELAKLQSMSLPQAAVYLSTTVKQQAESLKPKTSQAPEPADTLQGRGVAEQVSPLIQGATFD